MQSNAQTIINKTYAVKEGQKIEFKFDYPKIIRISTWDKNEISIQAKVSINEGENDAAFELQELSTANTISISNKIKDLDKLPKSYIVYEKGVKKIFRNKEAFKEYTEKSGRTTYNYSYSAQSDIEITLEIKVPANMATQVKAIYGLVELGEFSGSITVQSTYGGIDASLPEKPTGILKVTTNYGEIFSNLALTITDKSEKAFFTSFTAQNGTGPERKLESTYGNVYLRKVR